VWSFVFTGLAATLLYARHGSIDWRLVRWLVLGIVPAALLGALANGLLSASVLTAILALACVGTGVVALGRAADRERAAASFGARSVVLIGALVGFGSALSGAGGAAILMPLLLALQVPAIVAIGASQAIQLPVALVATLGYAPAGRVDFVFGSVLGAAEVLGVLVGARAAHAASPARLRRVTAVAVIAAGAILLLRLLLAG